jgi:nicotinamidase-related amidase
MLLDVSSAQLVLVDLQQKLMPAMHDSANIVANALRLAQAAQVLRVPCSVTEQNPAGLGRTVEPLAAFASVPLEKTSFSAVGDGLIERLEQLGTPRQPQQSSRTARSLPKHLRQTPAVNQRTDIVLAGCEAHVCVLQTAMDLLDNEFEVFLVTDACSSRTERNRDAAYDRLAAEGATLVTTEMVLFEWLRSSGHAQFKALHALIK